MKTNNIINISLNTSLDSKQIANKIIDNQLRKITSNSIEDLQLSSIENILNVDRSHIIEYLDSNNLDIQFINKVVPKIKRLPTHEDLKSIRLIGLENFIKYSRPLI